MVMGAGATSAETFLVAGMCRSLSDAGVHVATFKAIGVVRPGDQRRSASGRSRLVSRAPQGALAGLGRDHARVRVLP